MAGEYDLIVVGGGAAGFFGALACAAQQPDARVLILERGEALLRKVKISGGGRCNVTNATFDPRALAGNYPRGSRELIGPFTRFQPRDTLEWFQRRGVALKTEPDGRVFPASDSAQTIINCLLDEAGKLGVQIQTRASVTRIHAASSSFAVELRAGEVLNTRRVLLATGGERGGFALAQQLGHTILPPVPSLFTFRIQDPRLEGLAGLAVPDARLFLPEFHLEQRGPLLVTHWGLSGPAALKLSAWAARELHGANYRAALRVNWNAAQSVDTLYAKLLERRSSEPRKPAGAHDPLGSLPARLWKRLLAAAQIAPTSPLGEVSTQRIYTLAQQLANSEFSISGKGEFKEEFVTCGGVALKEVQFKTMESRVTPGLYLAGELLDIDGITGGFNFQAAWTTGWIAGKAAAEG